MSGSWKRLALAASAALAIGCATPPASQADDLVGAAPALFVARDEDSTLYLYGTIHLRRAGEPWGGPHIEAALEQSEEIWTEVEMAPGYEARAQQLAMQHGMAPPDQPLSSWLEASDQRRLAALTERLGMPAGAFEPLRPWLASLTLSILPVMQAGYDPQAGVDQAINTWGRANGRTMRGFESLEQQIGFFAGLDDDTQRQMLLSSLEGAERSVEMVDAMTTAWDGGDVAALESSVIAEIRDNYPAFYTRFIVDRNNAWMTVLTQELGGAGVDFVAVGAGHIVGEDGLVAQLRARGVHVERVN